MPAERTEPIYGRPKRIIACRTVAAAAAAARFRSSGTVFDSRAVHRPPTERRRRGRRVNGLVVSLCGTSVRRNATAGAGETLWRLSSTREVERATTINGSVGYTDFGGGLGTSITRSALPFSLPDIRLA